MADYVQSGGDPGRTRATPERVDPTGWTLLWTFHCAGPEGTRVPGNLVKKKDRLIVNDFPTDPPERTTIRSLDAVTGELQWQHELQVPGRFHIRALVDDQVLATGHEQPLISLSLHDGSELWRRERTNFSNPIVLDKDIIASIPAAGESDPWTIERVDASMAETRWSVRGAPSVQALSFSEGRLFTIEGEPGRESQLVARDASSGRTLWVSELPSAGRGYGRAVASSGPYVAVSMEAFADHGDGAGLRFGILACLEADTGRLLWGFQDPEPGQMSAPAISENRVCVTTGFVTPRYYCFELATGTIVARAAWPYENLLPPSNGFVAPPIYFHVISGGILRGALIESGAVCWEYRTDGVFGQPFVSDGRLYAANLDGYVYCFGLPR